MSLLDLRKEQKQYLILGVVAAVILAVLIVFGIKVSLSSISEARLELHGLTEKIESADKSVSANHRNDAEFRSTITELKAHLAKIPPDRNYYSWATEIIYNEARMVHFEIDTIDENTIAAPADDPKEQDVVVLESYSLRINAHGGYENVKGFLQRIDVIDAQIIALLNDRADIAVEIGDLKRGEDTPIYSPDREQRVLDRASDKLDVQTVRADATSPSTLKSIGRR